MPDPYACQRIGGTVAYNSRIIYIDVIIIACYTPLIVTYMSSYNKDQMGSAIVTVHGELLNIYNYDHEYLFVFCLGATSSTGLLQCVHCEKCFEDKNHFEKHQQICPMRPPLLVKVNDMTDFQNRSPRRKEMPVISPVIRPRPRWCTKPVHPDKHERAPKSDFMEYLGMTAKAKAEEMLKDENKSHDVECMILDIEPAPVTPSTPRSAKRYLSSLSRDFSPPPVPLKSPRISDVPEKEDIKIKSEIKTEIQEVGKIETEVQEVGKIETEVQEVGKIEIKTEEVKSEEKEEVKDDDKTSQGESEGESSEESDSESETKTEDTLKIRNHASLLVIPFSSLLGIRIKDKINYKRPQINRDDESDDEDGNYEKYCKTPKLNKFMNRLRTRDGLDGVKITFSKRHRIPDHLCHHIKFTKSERKEFLIQLKTGLTAEARRLKRSLKPCQVRLDRVSPKVIKKWKHKPRPGNHWNVQNKPQPSTFLPMPNGGFQFSMNNPAFHRAQRQQQLMLQQALELQRSTGLVAPQFLPTNFVAGPRAAQGPFPVHMTPNMFVGNNGMPRLVRAPNRPMYVHRAFKPAQRPQSMSNSNSGDAICISSDEEDDDDIKVTQVNQAPDNPGYQRPGPKSSKKSRQGVIRFKCHLCGTEINGQLGSTDFIAAHFKGVHDVHNIRLHESKDKNGQTVVTIVQDMPKTGLTNANAPRPANTNSNTMNNANRVLDDDDVICIDDD